MGRAIHILSLPTTKKYILYRQMKITMTDETLRLGGNIELSGFKDIDSGSVVILKKMAGNYARRYSELCKKFELLKLQMKKIHEKEKSEKYEVHGFVQDNGKHYSSHSTDMNLFFAVDQVLKKLEHEIGGK